MNDAKERIGGMFSRLSGRYDRFNRWSSLGLDQSWRRALERHVAGARAVLDVGAGTGDLSRLLAAEPGRRVVGVDLSLEMLRKARPQAGVEWVQASADALPFRSGVFDAVVSAYVMRNLHQAGVLKNSLEEAVRVLAPGGRAAFLDLTRPRNPFLRFGHGVYNRTVLPAVGRCVFGSDWPGDYLASSIAAFPAEDDIKRLFSESGFKDAVVRPLWGGVVSIFTGQKT